MAEALPGRLFMGELEIEQAVSAVASGIIGASQLPEVIVPIMSGAILFASDLMRVLSTRGLDLELLPLQVKRDMMHHGTPIIASQTRHNMHRVAGKHVLVVDTIHDSGHTRRYVTKWLLLHCLAAKVSFACLLARDAAMLRACPPAYCGRDMMRANDYVYGYGMDRNGMCRGLPTIRSEPPSTAIPESLVDSEDSN